MATNDWTDDDFDDEFEDAPQQQTNDADTKRFRDLRKAKKADEKRIKELTEQLESLSKAQRERVVKDVLTAKGVNPKAAKFILNDLQDVNDESVDKWLTDNGDLFGYQKQEPAVDPARQANLAELRQQDIVTQGAQAPDRNMDASRMIDEAGSADEIIRMIQSGQF